MNQIEKLNTIYVLSKNRGTNLTSEYLKQIDYPYWFVVIEDDEKYKEDYLRNYGDHVLTFNLGDYSDFDTYDHYSLHYPLGATPVRNFILDDSRKRGLKRVWEFDDDISCISFMKRVRTQIKIYDGLKLLKLLNIVSDLADSLKLEAVSLLDGVLVFYNKNQIQQGVPAVAMSIPTNTTFGFKNRLLGDATRWYDITRKGLLSFIFRFAIAKTKHCQTEGGMAKIKKDLNYDIMLLTLLKDFPLHKFIVQEEAFEYGASLSPRMKKKNLLPKLIKSEY